MPSHTTSDIMLQPAEGCLKLNNSAARRVSLLRLFKHTHLLKSRVSDSIPSRSLQGQTYLYLMMASRDLKSKDWAVWELQDGSKACWPSEKNIIISHRNKMLYDWPTKNKQVSKTYTWENSSTFLKILLLAPLELRQRLRGTKLWLCWGLWSRRDYRPAVPPVSVLS